eukprot:3080649-Amphidinium_carterae.2
MAWLSKRCIEFWNVAISVAHVQGVHGVDNLWHCHELSCLQHLHYQNHASQLFTHCFVNGSNSYESNVFGDPTGKYLPSFLVDCF